jgi:hypothetical protein
LALGQGHREAGQRDEPGITAIITGMITAFGAS